MKTHSSCSQTSVPWTCCCSAPLSDTVLSDLLIMQNRAWSHSPGDWSGGAMWLHWSHSLQTLPVNLSVCVWVTLSSALLLIILQALLPLPPPPHPHPPPPLLFVFSLPLIWVTDISVRNSAHMTAGCWDQNSESAELRTLSQSPLHTSLVLAELLRRPAGVTCLRSWKWVKLQKRLSSDSFCSHVNLVKIKNNLQYYTLN